MPKYIDYSILWKVLLILAYLSPFMFWDLNLLKYLICNLKYVDYFEIWTKAKDIKSHCMCL